MIAAVPVPFDGQGTIDRDAPTPAMSSTWRPSRSTEWPVWAQRAGLAAEPTHGADVLRDCACCARAIPPRDRGGGAGPAASTLGTVLATAREMADHAADLGATPLSTLHLRPRPARPRPPAVVAYHEAVAQAGLPLILFYSYENAGGVSYAPRVSRRAAGPARGDRNQGRDPRQRHDLPGRRALVRERFPDRPCWSRAKTGSSAIAALPRRGRADRHGLGPLGPSGRAPPSAPQARDAAAVPERPTARSTGWPVTPSAPMEGYIQRMLWCLVHDGIIPVDAATTPGARARPARSSTAWAVLASAEEGLSPDGRLMFTSSPAACPGRRAVPLAPARRRRSRRFAREGSPDPLEPYLRDAYGLDVRASYAGLPVRIPWGFASGQLSMRRAAGRCGGRRGTWFRRAQDGHRPGPARRPRGRLGVKGEPHGRRADRRPRHRRDPAGP